MCEENTQEIRHGVKTSSERWKILSIDLFNPLGVRNGKRRLSGGQDGLDDVIDGVCAGDDFRRGLGEFSSEIGGFCGIRGQRVYLFDQVRIANGFEQELRLCLNRMVGRVQIFRQG